MEKRVIVIGAMAICIAGFISAIFLLRAKVQNSAERLYAAATETIGSMANGHSVSSLKETIYLDSSSNELADSSNNVTGDAEVAPYEAPKEIVWCDFGKSGSPSHKGVILNEIAWMGSEASSGNEWIELKNLSSLPISIANWQLLDAGGQIKISFSADAKIAGEGFFLLERTGDDTVSGIAADKIYQGALSDAEESIRLYDEQCGLIDDAAANPNWPAGDRQDKKTMERNSADIGWHASERTGGTPRMANSQPSTQESAPQEEGAPKPPSETSDGEEQVQAPAPAVRVVLNEIQLAGETASDEFIELHNPTSHPITLTGWFVKRKSSTGTEYSLVVASRLEEKIIPAYGYLLLANEEGYGGNVQPDVVWPKSNSIAANNTILLYKPDGSVADKVGFGSAADYEGSAFAESPAPGQSISRTGGADTDNNAADFIISQSMPQNAQ